MKQAVLPSDQYKIDRLRDFLHYGNIKFFPKGSTIFMPGNSIKSLIFVVEGKAKVVIIKDDGTEILFFIAETNQTMGRLFDSTDTVLHGIAMEDTIVCFFNKEQLTQVFKADDEIIFDLLKNYTSKISYFKNKLTITNSSNSEIKVCSLLLLLCKNIHLEKNHGNPEMPLDLSEKYIINLGMSQKMLADIINVHPVTVSKVINQLTKDKIIAKNGKIITVNSPEKILQIIEENTEDFDLAMLDL